ncbi:MAG TPA: 1-deoxy-D-xylulose-5-phosphate reductoisomerase [Drouetiella sp.]
MKHISLLGSTGSIGTQTLDIAASHPDAIKVVALAAGSKKPELLAEQIRQFAPELVSVPTKADIDVVRELLGTECKNVELTCGNEGLEAVATHSKAETVVTGVVGFLGLKPTAAAIRKGKTIALANKETLVAAGAAIMPMVREHKTMIVPVDSEHSAIFQSLGGKQDFKKELDKIWLTASGGPFRTWTLEQIQHATVDDALKHPNWSMGPKITIDSSTLMNKGLEVIEARWLFDVDPASIRVVIHPQSILHSAVEFVDGSIVGQMGVPDMRLPIHYAIFYPERVHSSRVPRLNLLELNQMTFEKPDTVKFPCLAIAQEIAAENNTLPCVLNAANEVVVDFFLKGFVKFCDIPTQIRRVLEKHKPVEKPNLDDILDADQWARRQAVELLSAVRN